MPILADSYLFSRLIEIIDEDFGGEPEEKARRFFFQKGIKYEN